MYVKSVFFAFFVKHVASMSALQQTNMVTYVIACRPNCDVSALYAARHCVVVYIAQAHSLSLIQVYKSPTNCLHAKIEH